MSSQRLTRRPARTDDAPVVADIWRRGWRDGHVGHVPDALVAVRTDESFDTRAAQRVGDTVVATVDGEVAGFIMVVGDEVEQVYVAVETRWGGGGDAVRDVGASGGGARDNT